MSVSGGPVLRRFVRGGWNRAPLATWTGAVFAVAAQPPEASSNVAAEPDRDLATDRMWVDRARRGDRLALRQIYERHRRLVGRYLLLLSGDRHAVDDLVQETFVTAFRRLDRYDGTCRLGTWLCGIGRNLARNHLAKRRRRQRLLEAHGEALSHPTSAGAAADTAAREKEALDLLYAALDRLPAEQREAFVARVLERRPLADASRLLGVPVATVSYRARKAEEQVRKTLREWGIEA
ncbi:MAG: RNA polymerase sigma factor [Deltaproteobacteria bacterium]|nr:MAG: RNA polymerase sigma factor [Deltaproteobacteria bacterium]